MERSNDVSRRLVVASKLHVRDCILGLLISLNAGVIAEGQRSSNSTIPKAGVCVRDAPKLIGAHPVEVSKLVRAPKKIKDVHPE